ncbi:MAG: hypothetical protein CMJ34_04395 [Phycisphaerae bacterium]|nr:hypothetical protein [Phycisphaerae bacterium]
MRVLVDDQPCSTTATTIGEAVAAAADAAEKAGRLVIEVLVDGTSLSEEDLQETTRLAGSAEEVRLMTTTMNDLLRDTFVHAAEALSDAAEVQKEAAGFIQSGRQSEGMQSLLASLETWGGIRDAVVKGLALAGISPEEVVIEGIGLPDAIGRLQVRLGGLKEAMAANDVSATCDCLLYDLPESTSEWRTILSGLATRFSSEA